MTWLWKKRIDDSTSMHPLGRDLFLYREGERTLHVVAELMASGPPDRVIYADSIDCWLPPFDGDVIDQEARERILEKIARFFRNNHVSCVVE